MKRFLCVLTVLALCGAMLCGCSSENAEKTAESTTVTKQTTEITTAESTTEGTTAAETTTQKEKAQTTTKKKNSEKSGGNSSSGSSSSSNGGNSSSNGKNNNSSSGNSGSSSSSSSSGSSSGSGSSSSGSHQHTMPVGDIGKWFDSRQELVNYYNSVVNNWNNKLLNGSISREEYIANCPQGYECWSCSCGKWSGNFKYDR